MRLIAKSTEEINPKIQSITIIGCSLIAIGEQIGMLSRSFNHFILFGYINIKKNCIFTYCFIKLSNLKAIFIDSYQNFDMIQIKYWQ